MRTTVGAPEPPEPHNALFAVTITPMHATWTFVNVAGAAQLNG